MEPLDKGLPVKGHIMKETFTTYDKILKEPFKFNCIYHCKQWGIKKQNSHILCTVVATSGIGGFSLKIAMSIVPCLGTEHLQCLKH